MTHSDALGSAESQVEALLERNPRVQRAAPEPPFDGCFVLPVTRSEVGSYGLQLNHGVETRGEPEPEGAGEYRLFIGVRVGREPSGKVGIHQAADLEHRLRTPADPEGQWVSSTHLWDPGLGEWRTITPPQQLGRMLDGICPEWRRVAQAEAVRLALVGEE